MKIIICTGLLLLACDGAFAAQNLGALSQPTTRTVTESGSAYTDTAVVDVINWGVDITATGQNLCWGGGRGGAIRCLEVTIDTVSLTDEFGTSVVTFTNTETCYIYSCAYKHDVQNGHEVLANGSYNLTVIGTIRQTLNGAPVTPPSGSYAVQIQ
jgi:hypothetical protein